MEEWRGKTSTVRGMESGRHDKLQTLPSPGHADW